MNIYLLGINFKTAPLSVREKVTFSVRKLDKAVILLSTIPDIEECVVLSTCNRVEIYVSSDSAECIESVKEFLTKFHNLKCDLTPYYYNYQGLQAVEHLFCVASSLDSMVIGENQILGQIKEAYLAARECETVGRSLSILFENAIKTGKRVRSQTGIGRGSVSISSAAVELAKRVVKNLESKKVLIIGAGKIGELTVKNLAERGVSTICVANRTYQRAVSLAASFGGKVVKYDSLQWALGNVDIVISSTSAPHFIIKKHDIQEVMAKKESPLFLIDLGVPRNIENSISDINNVHLYNINDLIRVKDENIARRYKEIDKAREIVVSAAELFLKKYGKVKCTVKE